MLKEFIDLREAAQFSGISRSLLQKYRYLGTGPKSCVINNRVMYRREDITAWLEAQIAATTRGGIHTMA